MRLLLNPLAMWPPLNPPPICPPPNPPPAAMGEDAGGRLGPELQAIKF